MRQHQVPPYLLSMAQGQKNEGLAYSRQRQLSAPTSRPIRWKMGTLQVQSMGKLNADDRIQMYRYVMIHSSINVASSQPALFVADAFEKEIC